MPQKRKYFKSTQQQFTFSKVPETPYLYIYKHHCPQIIVRFSEPKKTITGFDVTRVEIVYWPFYEDVLAGMGEGYGYQGERIGGDVAQKANIEKIEFPYKGELILNKEADIFVEFLKRQFQSIMEQNKNNPPPRQRPSFTYNHRPPIKIQISQVFQILLNEWFLNPFINAIFLSTQKHLKTFTSFDHGFLKLQILKTSLTNTQLPFYKSPTARLRQIKQLDNKHYYFEFQSSVLYENKDFQDVQKVGVIMPRPISMNEFFYEVLIQMFQEFEQEVEKKKEKEKKREERMRIKESLLQNFRNMGLEPKLPDIRVANDEWFEQHIQTEADPLDVMLNQIFAKKKKLKQDETKKQATSTSQIQNSTIKPRRLSVVQNSPEKKQQNHEEPEDEQTKRKSIPRKNIKIQQNIKVIRSFTSEIIDQDFQPKSQRRFVTRGQFDKLIKLSEKIHAKREEKRAKGLLQGDKKEQMKQEWKKRENIRQQKKQQQLVFVGVKTNQQSTNTSTKKAKNLKPNFMFDYFSTHHDTLILEKKQPHNPYADQNKSLSKKPFHLQSRVEEIDPILIAGLEEISIIEKKSGERHSKIKALELMYEGNDSSMNRGVQGEYVNDDGFDIDDSDYNLET